MRILLSMPSYYVGGSEKRYLNIVNYLARNYDVSVTLYLTQILYERLGIDKDTLPENLSVIIKYKAGWKYKLSCLPLMSLRFKLVNMLVNFTYTRVRDFILHFSESRIDPREYDVWHSINQSGYPGVLNQYRKNIVYSLADNELCRIGRVGTSLQIYRDIARGRQFEILSPLIHDLLTAHFKLDPNLDNLNIAPCSFIDHDKVGDVDFTNKKLQVVFLGRMHRVKNPLLFVEIASGVLAKNQDIDFIMIGSGPDEAAVLDRVKYLDIPANNFRHIKTFNPIQDLKESVLYLSLQNGDNYPSQALIEAMSAGCAVLASNTGYTHLLVKPDTGVLNELDKDEIVNIILRMFENPDDLIKLGMRASEFVKSNFTAQEYCDFLMTIYEKALNDSSNS